MKLLTKTSLLFLLTSLLVFAAGIFIFQQHLDAILKEESDEILQGEKDQVLQFIDEHQALPNNELSIGDRISAAKSGVPVSERFRDTLIYIDTEKEMHPYRQLTFPAKVQGEHYAVSIFSPVLEEDDLSETILTSFIYLVVILLAAVMVVNVLLSRFVWRPFYRTIDLLRQYAPGGDRPALPSTGTKEFKELLHTIEKMTDKIERDYRELKSFTENASHELRTPLAVMSTSLEEMLQDERLTEKQHEELSRLLRTVQRLNRLNQALLLLAKIENRQFNNQESTDLSALIEKRAEAYRELAAHQAMPFSVSIEKNIRANIHHELAGILISNLLSNALRHNTAGGEIAVSLSTGIFTVCNAGEKAVADPNRLFERFYKESDAAESTGLGLAIVKQITLSAGMDIAYRFSGGRHCFIVSF